LNNANLLLYFRLIKSIVDQSKKEKFPLKLIVPSLKIFVKKIISLNSFSLYNDKNEKENAFLTEIYCFFFDNAASICKCFQNENEQPIFNDIVIHIERLFEMFKFEKIDKESINSNTEKVKVSLFKCLPKVKQTN